MVKLYSLTDLTFVFIVQEHSNTFNTCRLLNQDALDWSKCYDEYNVTKNIFKM